MIETEVAPIIAGHAVTKTLHKLAALRLLSERMIALEKQREKRIEHGDDPAEVTGKLRSTH